MKEGYNGTREISIVDMLLYICQRWRSIIICLIIGAIVFSVYGYFTSAKKKVTMTQAEQAIYNLQKDEAEQEIIQTELLAKQIKQLEAYVDAQVDFNEKAMLMRIDPYNTKVYEIKYYIDNSYSGDGTNYQANAIAEAYVSALRSKGFAVNMEKTLLGTEEATLLYSYYNDVISIETGEDTGIFTVSLYGNTRENAEKVAGVVKQTMNDAYASNVSLVGNYSISIIGESCCTSVEGWIRDLQQEMSDKAISMSKRIKELKDSVTNSDQKIYLEYLLNLDEEELSDEIESAGIGMTEEAAEATVLTDTNSKRSFSLKNVVIGGFLGAVLAAIFYLIRYVALGVLMTKDEINDSFGIQVLGTFAADSDFNKKRKTKLDKWLLGLRRKSKNSLSYKESVEMVSAKVQIAAEKNSMKRLCLALGKNLGDNKNFVDDVVKELQKNLSITVVSNVLGEAESFSDMSAGDAVVLIEQLEVSKHKDVYSECMLCSTYGVSIIGAVIVE